MKNKLTIVKVGGFIFEDEYKLDSFLSNFSKIIGNKILVHGGGKIASNFSKKLGIDPIMLEGRRVTDKETLDVVVMTYAGLLNKKLVSKLVDISYRKAGLKKTVIFADQLMYLGFDFSLQFIPGLTYATSVSVSSAVCMPRCLPRPNA